MGIMSEFATPPKEYFEDVSRRTGLEEIDTFESKSGNINTVSVAIGLSELTDTLRNNQRRYVDEIANLTEVQRRTSWINHHLSRRAWQMVSIWSKATYGQKHIPTTNYSSYFCEKFESTLIESIESKTRKPIVVLDDDSRVLGCFKQEGNQTFIATRDATDLGILHGGLYDFGFIKFDEGCKYISIRDVMKDTRKREAPRSAKTNTVYPALNRPTYLIVPQEIRRQMPNTPTRTIMDSEQSIKRKLDNIGFAAVDGRKKYFDLSAK